MTKIQTFIQDIHLLPTEVLNELLTKLTLLELPPQTFLLNEGKTCKDIWFIEKGLVSPRCSECSISHSEPKINRVFVTQ